MNSSDVVMGDFIIPININPGMSMTPSFEEMKVYRYTHHNE